MSYLYFANLDPSDRLNQLEIQLDNGTTAILRLGHSYDLTANELARARRYAVLTSTTEPADESPIGIARLPVKGNPISGQIPQWSASEGAFTPQTVSGVSGGPYASTASLAAVQADVDAVESSITSMRASYFVNARDGYGWIGDGTYHPLSEKFTTLAAAQVTYPHATALTDATDWAALQGAMNAAATKGQAVYADGTGISDKGFTHPSHVHVWGPGGMTNLFASTDAAFKQTAGLTIRLKAGVTVDALWKSANYDTITGTASPNVYTALPWHMGLHYLKLDGNSIGGSTCTVAKVYCNRFRQNDVDYVNGLSGGLVGEIQAGGYDMEWQSTNVNIAGCGGKSLNAKSLHDSQWTNLIVKTPGGTTGSPTDGVYVDPAGNSGGEQFTNCHVWGTFSNAHWMLGSSNATYANCTADGGGIQLVGSGNRFDGSIYGTNTPGQWVVKIGDGTARTIGRNKVDVRVFNFKASPFAVQTLNTVDDGNRFEATANMGGVVRYGSKGNVYKLTSSAVTSDVTLNVTSTTDLPASGTLYADDGTNRTASLAYTGKTSTTLTGVTVIPAAGLANGAALWLASGFSGASDLGLSSFKVWNYDATTNAGQILERATPTSQAGHTAEHTFTGIYSPVEGVKLGSGGTQIKKHLSATASWDPPSVVNGASTTTTITVTGAALGDTVAVGFTSLVTGWTITGLVTATNTVEVRITNNTGGTVDLASGTLRADVWQH
jgi:hypothetical protein